MSKEIVINTSSEEEKIELPPASRRDAQPGGLVPMKKRDYKKMIGVIFFVILFVLIFFSKTIYGYNLPIVTAVKPENGRLNKLELGTGVADYAKTQNVYAPVGGLVSEVLVQEGDAVKAGQPLYNLTFDRDETGRKLEEIANSRKRLNNDIKNINLKIEKLQRAIDGLVNEVYEIEPVSDYDLELIKLEIRQAELELDDVLAKYDAGQATELDVQRAENKIETLELKREELRRKLEEQARESWESIEDKEKEREEKLKDYEADLSILKLDKSSKQVDIDNLSLQEESYKKTLEDFDENSVISAPLDGTVISVPINKGETIRSEQQIATIGSDEGFQVECSVSLENDFVTSGDVVELSNATHAVEGVVDYVTPQAQGKSATITISSGEVTAGETFEVTFEKRSETTYTLVPNGAINQDNDGYFLNLIKRRDGILGEEYYLERLDVYIGDSDSKNTAVIRGITFFEPIALVSDKPISPGDAIVLSNAGDFFEQ